MVQYATPQLNLDQAYQAAFLWLDHIGQTPTSISEPADGVIELSTPEVVARIRWSRTPITQGAVLAMLRQTETSVKRLLFSVTGFSPGAVSLADTQGVALYAIDADGHVTAVNAHGISLMPPKSPQPPFVPNQKKDDLVGVPVVTTSPENMEYDVSEWLNCPRCGLTHHAKSNFCMNCGADLHLSRPPEQEGPKPALRPRSHKKKSKSTEDRSKPYLQCRTCGSDDIELIHPGYAAE